MREEGNHQLPIYYVCEVLLATETTYPDMEKSFLFDDYLQEIEAIFPNLCHSSNNKFPARTSALEA